MKKTINDIDSLPQGLIDDLKAREHRVTVLTGRVDREMESLSRRHFAERRVLRPMWRPAWAAAAAAVLVLTAVLGPFLFRDGLQSGDYDGSGQVDIGDVLYIAREDRSREEIDALASQIVSIERWEDAS